MPPAPALRCVHPCWCPAAVGDAAAASWIRYGETSTNYMQQLQAAVPHEAMQAAAQTAHNAIAGAANLASNVTANASADALRAASQRAVQAASQAAVKAAVQNPGAALTAVIAASAAQVRIRRALHRAEIDRCQLILTFHTILPML